MSNPKDSFTKNLRHKDRVAHKLFQKGWGELESWEQDEVEAEAFQELEEDINSSPHPQILRCTPY